MAHLVNKYYPDTDAFSPPAIVEPSSIGWYKDNTYNKPYSGVTEDSFNSAAKDRLLSGTDLLSVRLRAALSSHRANREPYTASHLPHSISNSTSDALSRIMAADTSSKYNTSLNDKKLDLYGATDMKRGLAVSNDLATTYPSRINDFKSLSKTSMNAANLPLNNYISTYTSTYKAPASIVKELKSKDRSSTPKESKLNPYLSPALRTYTPSTPAAKKENKSVDFVTSNSRPVTSSQLMQRTERSPSVSSNSPALRLSAKSPAYTNYPSTASDEFYMKKLGEILNVHYLPIFTSNPSQITDYMYVGGYRDAENWQLLKKLGITHVLNMAAFRKSAVNPYPPQSGIVGYEGIDADDVEGYNVMQHFPKAKAFIDRARWSNGKVLVHCAMGVNRSGTMCCSYIMSEHKIPLLEAARKMKKARGTTLTNRGFQRQLVRFARQKNLLG